MISILVPTRNRPHNLKRLLESLESTAVASVEVVLRLDLDDCCISRYMDAIKASKIEVKAVIGKRTGFISDYYNDAWKVGNGDIFMMGDDDIVFNTPEWDIRVAKEFDDKPLLVYGCDGIHNERLATHSLVNKAWTSALGYFSPPCGLRHNFPDTWLQDLGRLAGKIKHLPWLDIEHLHHVVGKASSDVVYTEANDSFAHDYNLFNALERQRIADAEKLKI